MAQKRATKPSKTSPETLMLGYLCIRGVGDTLEEQIAILDRFGLGDADIATICNVKPRAIKDARYEKKRKKTSKPK